MRYLIFALIAFGVFALVRRARRAQWLFYALLGVMILYTLLKLTGVIEAIAPARDGGVY